MHDLVWGSSTLPFFIAPGSVQALRQATPDTPGCTGPVFAPPVFVYDYVRLSPSMWAVASAKVQGYRRQRILSLFFIYSKLSSVINFTVANKK